MEEGRGRNNRPFEVVSIFLIVAASAASWMISSSYKVPLGVLAGGLIGVINFKWLGSIVRGAFSKGSAAGYTVRYLLKFLFVILFSGFLIYSRVVDPLAFLVGFTITVIIVSLQGTELTRS